VHSERNVNNHRSDILNDGFVFLSTVIRIIRNAYDVAVLYIHTA